MQVDMVEMMFERLQGGAGKGRQGEALRDADHEAGHAGSGRGFVFA